MTYPVGQVSLYSPQQVKGLFGVLEGARTCEAVRMQHGPHYRPVLVTVRRNGASERLEDYRIDGVK